jgi:hypothetical protein
MHTVDDVKREYGERQARILNEVFALSLGALEVDIELSGGVKETLAPHDYNKLRAAEQEVWAAGERLRLKTLFEEMDVEKRAAIEVLVEEAERELSPKEGSAQDILAASSADAEQLRNALSAALRLGEAGEDSALLFFQTARQKDFDDVVAWATDLRPDWAEAYVVILEGTSQPDVDPGDRFEQLAAAAPSKYELFSASQPDINFFGGLR